MLRKLEKAWTVDKNCQHWFQDAAHSHETVACEVADWFIQWANFIAKGKEAVIGGWRASGISDAVKERAKNLPTLDLFADVDPLETSLEDMFPINSFPKPGLADVYERNIDSDSEFWIPGRR